MEREERGECPSVRASEAARSEAAGSEEAVMGESIGVEWIHLPFYEAIRSGRGRAVSGGKAGVTKSRMNTARQRSFTISIPLSLRDEENKTSLPELVSIQIFFPSS